eukprot:gnl/TRDRNA2_/TRDRNA2_165086_c0_seq1.p1 gnl/TRDRNA2_/TRDRNA2_165086_c0~~gnl/TRDRNA2_/TRDRNA2_165086_c0_seq1.p1  ORF type:complete len:153 (+),score=28.15 gnl/TRDRNA2_/TRDRNA2_165086_c0_seq1:2-460(+)
MSSRAEALKEPAPSVYRNLVGKFGLITEDPIWSSMNQPEPQIGMTITTTAIVAGYSGRAYFQDDQGFYVSVNRGGKMVYEFQDSDVVEFKSTMRDASGFHSLIPAAACTFDLPPTAEVKLESIKAPGTWKVYEKSIQRRLLVVSVTYGLSAV